MKVNLFIIIIIYFLFYFILFFLLTRLEYSYSCNVSSTSGCQRKCQGQKNISYIIAEGRWKIANVILNIFTCILDFENRGKSTGLTLPILQIQVSHKSDRISGGGKKPSLSNRSRIKVFDASEQVLIMITVRRKIAFFCVYGFN